MFDLTYPRLHLFIVILRLALVYYWNYMVCSFSLKDKVLIYPCYRYNEQRRRNCCLKISENDSISKEIVWIQLRVRMKLHREYFPSWTHGVIKAGTADTSRTRKGQSQPLKFKRILRHTRYLSGSKVPVRKNYYIALLRYNI